MQLLHPNSSFFRVGRWLQAAKLGRKRLIAVHFRAGDKSPNRSGGLTTEGIDPVGSVLNTGPKRERLILRLATFSMR